MSKAKHTRGPWREVKNKDGTINIVGAKDDDGFSGKVALVNNGNAINARLIAAAPDMYEALRLASGVITGEVMHKQGVVDALSAVRAALAKAEPAP